MEDVVNVQVVRSLNHPLRNAGSGLVFCDPAICGSWTQTLRGAKVGPVVSLKSIANDVGGYEPSAAESS